MLKIFPLGGCGEIGMNLTVLQVDNEAYIIDCGALFPDAKLIGVDLIVPDISCLFPKTLNFRGWLITHGHEDHIGALPFLFKKIPMPIYCYGFGKELITEKMREYGTGQLDLREWQLYKRNPVTGGIKVTPFLVNHSIPDSLGFFIETKYGNILHPGDHRIDYSPAEGITTLESIKKALQGKKVRLLMSDSTNSFSPGHDKDEVDLSPSFDEILAKTQGAVLVTTFASNIWRINSLIEAAVRNKRKIVVAGRSMKRNTDIADRLGLSKIPEGLFVPEERVGYERKSDLMVLCTGSQGEQTASLYKIASRGLGALRVDEKDAVVFSSRSIPGNERSIGDVINLISRRGTQVITAREANIHASGHGYQDDLKAVIKLADPEMFMPVHGEYRHLKQHIKLANEVGIPPTKCFLVENGDVLRFDGEPDVVSRVESGRDYVCSGQMMSEKSEVYKQRQQVGRLGVIHVIFTTDADLEELVAEPVVTFVGAPEVEGNRLEEIESMFFDALDVHKKKKTREENFEEDLRIRLRRFFESNIGYKSKVIVVLQKLTN